ncbi:MAG: methionine synthase [Deltaproteobacteria bacterium CG2_30_63_29]|nr:MAG: methionine synthase [Deltaproteobacteria bacterium CG2_30_63_29]PJB34801.1 MAG: methionine synthase [Deltaproteobacteria bacterium CG_4_9_14_3_um_filter_63_12]
MKVSPAKPSLKDAIDQQLLIIDGAMGTMIQRHRLSESDFRGARFADHLSDLQGNNDLLNLTQPAIIENIHRLYLEAGANIIETNTFNANALSQADYGLQDLVGELNQAAAQTARRAVDRFLEMHPERLCFVAGSVGPTNQTLSLSPDVDDPSIRSTTYDLMRQAYEDQITGLVEGGVDLILIETIFDTLNAKAAIHAAQNVAERRELDLPIAISVTLPDASGRTLSGQTLEAFWISVQHAKPVFLGLNCGQGAAELESYVALAAHDFPVPIAFYPNAGLPNELGNYTQTPEDMANTLGALAKRGWLNLVGGCCGTTPEHIAAIAARMPAATRRTPPESTHITSLSGLEPMVLRPELGFAIVGERTNVTGSRRFAKLIREGDLRAALTVARKQVEGGANVLDVNMDEGLLDSKTIMVNFLRALATEPEIAKIPIMVDSSKFEVLLAGLQQLQGKAVVNSISLKDGEHEFLARAKAIRRMGAAAVVMAFDEQGQATNTEQRVAILTRAHHLLICHGFPEEDILFDPNVLTIGTGIEEHANYARSFIETCALLSRRFPLSKLIGGVSNLSFAFRGNDTVREAMNAAFLYHAIAAGLDLGIVNAGQVAVYEEIHPELRALVEAVIFNTSPNATDELLERAAEFTKDPNDKAAPETDWTTLGLEERIVSSLVRGIDEHVEVDMTAALERWKDPVQIIEGPLMNGMNRVGELFGAGKMFLPQVVKSARVMKRAVAFLEPFLEKKGGQVRHRGRILMATVKGDVHDIGKNIVSVILQCNNIDVVDLGVMVPAHRIVAEALEKNVDLVGLSGLITPSLDEMVFVAQQLSEAGWTKGLLIGGATTSKRHTALRIAPAYAGTAHYVPDASRAPKVALDLLDDVRGPQLARETQRAQEELRTLYKERSRPLMAYADAVGNAFQRNDYTSPAPPFWGPMVLTPSVADLAPFIDWSPLFSAWDLRGSYPKIFDDPEKGAAAKELFANAQTLLAEAIEKNSLKPCGVYGYFSVQATGDDVNVFSEHASAQPLEQLIFLRQQQTKAGEEQANLSLADFLASEQRDVLALFAVSSGFGVETLAQQHVDNHDDYNAILIKVLADRLAEAFAEWLHQRVRKEWFAPNEDLTIRQLHQERYRGIRPAFGYPACPDHSEKDKLFALLDATQRCGISLTESWSMNPAASVSGMVFSNPHARYFSIPRIGPDQLRDWARRKNLDVNQAKTRLATLLQI